MQTRLTKKFELAGRAAPSTDGMRVGSFSATRICPKMEPALHTLLREQGRYIFGQDAKLQLNDRGAYHRAWLPGTR